MQSEYNAPEAGGFSRRTASKVLEIRQYSCVLFLAGQKNPTASGRRFCAQQSGCGRHSAQNALYPDCIDYSLLKIGKNREALADFGAGDGNRTHTTSLEGWDSAIELHPHFTAGFIVTYPLPFVKCFLPVMPRRDSSKRGRCRRKARRECGGWRPRGRR